MKFLESIKNKRFRLHGVNEARVDNEEVNGDTRPNVASAMTGHVTYLSNEQHIDEDELEQKSKLTSSTGMNNMKSRNKPRVSRNGDTASSNLFGTSQDFRAKYEPQVTVSRRQRNNRDKV